MNKQRYKSLKQKWNSLVLLQPKMIQDELKCRLTFLNLRKYILFAIPEGLHLHGKADEFCMG